MRFLQKPKEHQDGVPTAHEPRHSNKNERKRTGEEEISAYFGAKRPSINSHDVTAEKRRPHTNRGQGHASRDDREHELDRRITPVVELPDKQFLRFRSKNRQQEHRDSCSEKPTYFTWSDSTPRASPRLRQQLAVPTCDAGRPSAELPLQDQHRSTERRKASHFTTNGAIRQHEDQEPSERGNWTQTRRTRGPTLVELSQPPARPQYRHHQDQTSPINTTSQSLPRHPAKTSLAQHEQRRSDARPNRQHSYHTSDILKVKDLPSNLRRSIVEPQTRELVHSDKENENPRSSFHIDEILRNVREAMSKAGVVPQSPHKPARIASRLHDDTENIVEEGLTVDDLQERGQHNVARPSQHRQYQGQYQGQAWTGRHGWTDAPRPSVPEVDFQTWTEPQRPGTAFGQPIAAGLPVGSYEDKEMLDDHAEIELLMSDGIHNDIEEPLVDGDALGSMSIPHSSIYESQVNRGEHEAAFERTFDNTVSESTSPHCKRSLGYKHNEGRHEPVETELVGFWKPNRLY